MSNINYSSYQLAHLSKLYSNGFDSLLICDGVGVGKTCSAVTISNSIGHVQQLDIMNMVLLCS